MELDAALARRRDEGHRVHHERRAHRRAIWADSNGTLYAVSQTDGNVISSSGNGSWSVAASLGVYDLWGIWGSGPGDIYVVGDGGAVIHVAQ